MKRIALDMDGVLADVYEQFFEMDEKDFGKRRSWEEVAGKKERESFPRIREYVHTPGFFRTPKVMSGSQEVVAELNKKYDLYIVSAAMEFPLSLSEKPLWLKEHFPFITWQQIIFCGSKQIVQADIMIDDHFKNLDAFTGEMTILFTQPHNVYTDNGRHLRADDWNDIAEILL